MTWSPELEPYIRLGSFLSIFVVMALWEMVAPCRQLITKRRSRWLHNVGLTWRSAMKFRGAKISC